MARSAWLKAMASHIRLLWTSHILRWALVRPTVRLSETRIPVVMMTGAGLPSPKGARDSMNSRFVLSTMAGPASQSISIEGTAVAGETRLEAMSSISALSSSSSPVGTVNPAAAGCPP